MVLYPHSFDGHDYCFWDKVGVAVGNLQALKKLFISNHSNHYGVTQEDVENEDDDDQEVIPIVPVPDWEILACILRHVRQKVSVEIHESHRWAIEEVQPFTRAIHGHPTIIILRHVVFHLGNTTRSEIDYML